jgi:sugar lactone lactonase YvrE
MTTTYATAVLHRGLMFGEAPRWHEGRLWFSDFHRHGVFSLGDDGERLEHALDAQPSGLGWQPDGTLLVVSMTDHRVLAVAPDGTVTTHADLSAHARFLSNDMVVASDGSAYVGNFGYDIDAFLDEHGVRGVLASPGPPTTTVVSIAPDGSVRQVVDDLSFPNGMVLADDGATLIVAETTRFRLTAFAVARDGALTDRRVFAQLDRVFADGICLDAEGQVWVANASGHECLRVKDGGEVTARVETQANSYACMLGGDDRRTLYVMTAPSSVADVVTVTHDAQVEVALVDVPGAGLP